MKIAVEGCAHGELETIYNVIKVLEEREEVKIDLLIICGDFQACRNENDLYCMAVPQKYCQMKSFYKYYNGTNKAPVLTIFIGGNHEASNYLQELPYGGWVAPNIYYLGYAGVINIAGVRIGGISGIYKTQDFLKGRYETVPYSNNTKRSVYHIRNLDIFRLKQISQPIDIFISHDWPMNIWNYGNLKQLLRFKPYLKEDIDSKKLGNRPCKELLMKLQPNYYFAAHMHCKFAALVKHDNHKVTKFLALDKCLPHRRFLQILDVPHDGSSKIQLKYDLEWLTILSLTNHLISTKESFNYLPGNMSNERWNFKPTREEKSLVLMKFSNNMVIPENFEKTADGYNANDLKSDLTNQLLPLTNQQTVLFCNTLGVDDPLNLLGVLIPCSKLNINDSFIYNEQETAVSESFIKSSPSKLKLSLPEPKFQCNISGDISAISNNTWNVDVNEKKSEAEKNYPSVPNKFKRRNASLYCTQNIDNL